MAPDEDADSVRPGLVVREHMSDGAMGRVVADPGQTVMYLRRKGMIANLYEDEAEDVTVAASAKRFSRPVVLSVISEAGEDVSGHTTTRLTPQAALRLVEQLLTATQSALAEQRWSPEHSPGEYAYDLGVLEDTDVDTGGGE